MRFIAVLGVLFVLASCSDSDLPDNFAVSCSIYQDGKPSISFEFDFDKNLVTETIIMDNFLNGMSTERQITKILPGRIIFETETEEWIERYRFNRTSLLLVFHNIVFSKGIIKTESIENTTNYFCQLT